MSYIYKLRKYILEPLDTPNQTRQTETEQKGITLNRCHMKTKRTNEMA
jgi:hypothetical protein